MLVERFSRRFTFAPEVRDEAVEREMMRFMILPDTYIHQ